MKYIVIVPDGMADEPIEALGGKTPLASAQTPNMDYLAQHGRVGLVKTIPDQMHPGSDIGNLALLGYDPQKHSCGRAPLEAANLNISLADDEVVFRCNLVTIDDGKMVDYSAGHISTKEADILIDELNKNLDKLNTHDSDVKSIRFHAGKSYRHLMLMKTSNISGMTHIQCTPPHDIIGRKIKDYLPQGPKREIFLKLMEKSESVLMNHSINAVRIDLKENPANMIWLWGQGRNPQFSSFMEKFGVKGSIISAVDLVCGIGKLIGLDVLDVPGITGYYDTNYLGKAEHGLKALKKHDFIFIHIEAPDEAGHNGDVRAKIACIERIDKDIVGTILKKFQPTHGFLEDVDLRILIAPDHPTPVEKRHHTADPVCFLMYGKGIAADGAAEYNEASAKEKGLQFSSGEELMQYFMKANL